MDEMTEAKMPVKPDEGNDCPTCGAQMIGKPRACARHGEPGTPWPVEQSKGTPMADEWSEQELQGTPSLNPNELCTVCQRDNDNGTHDALEQTGHLSHSFTTSEYPPMLKADRMAEVQRKAAVGWGAEAAGQRSMPDIGWREPHAVQLATRLLEAASECQGVTMKDILRDMTQEQIDHIHLSMKRALAAIDAHDEERRND